MVEECEFAVEDIREGHMEIWFGRVLKLKRIYTDNTNMSLCSECGIEHCPNV